MPYMTGALCRNRYLVFFSKFLVLIYYYCDLKVLTRLDKTDSKLTNFTIWNLCKIYTNLKSVVIHIIALRIHINFLCLVSAILPGIALCIYHLSCKFLYSIFLSFPLFQNIFADHLGIPQPYHTQLSVLPGLLPNLCDTHTHTPKRKESSIMRKFCFKKQNWLWVWTCSSGYVAIQIIIVLF